MDDTLLFIPPCCVDKKLPQAVIQAPARALTFYTHGDVTMEKIYRAIAFLIKDPHVMVLSMPVVPAETVVFLQQCFERGWITDLVLSTSRDCAVLVDKYLCDYSRNVLYTPADDVSDVSSHLVMYSAEQSITIIGPMYERAYPVKLAGYSLVFYPHHGLFTDKADWGNALRNILFPDVLRHRKVALGKQPKQVSIALDKFLHMEFPSYNIELIE